MKHKLTMLLLLFLIASEAKAQTPPKQNVWVFIMAGQSNMAGRGTVEAQDTITNQRMLTIDADGNVIEAKEPLHFYEPKMAGLDCGLSFATELLRHIPDSICILMIPTAVGGSSINRWLDDKPHRGVALQSNFANKVALAKQYGEIKAVLWHQGESDANVKGIASRQQKLKLLFSKFRQVADNESLPIIIGELGSFSKEAPLWNTMNEASRQYAETDGNCTTISTADLNHRGDKVHFNSKSQREMGRRFAQSYLENFR